MTSSSATRPWVDHDYEEIDFQSKNKINNDRESEEIYELDKINKSVSKDTCEAEHIDIITNKGDERINENTITNDDNVDNERIKIKESFMKQEKNITNNLENECQPMKAIKRDYNG